MTTARDLITSAFLKAKIIGRNETPSAEEMNDGLVSLNDILYSLSNDSLILYTRTSESFSLSAGTASYTIGDGATFDTVRPLVILTAFVRNDGNIDYPLQIISDEEYQGVSDKTTHGIPQYLNYSGAYPEGTITVFPVPDTAYTLHLLSEKELSQFDTLNTSASFPPGWERMLKYNLAMELFSEYGQEPDAGTARIASESLALIKKGNLKRGNKNRYFTAPYFSRSIYSGWE